MSELQELLDEIRGEDELATSEDVPNVASEVHEDDTTEEEEVDLHKPLSVEQLEEVTTYNLRQSVYRSVATEAKVCRSVVMEAMAALPPPNHAVVSAKLTSIPSVVNKSILESMQAGDEYELSQKTDEYAQSVLTGLRGILRKNEGVVESYLGTIEVLSGLADGPAVIFMETKDAVNLFTSDFETLSMLHFHPDKIMFDPVKVDAVAEASRALIYDRQFGELTKGNFKDLLSRLKVKVTFLHGLLSRIETCAAVLKEPDQPQQIKLGEVEQGSSLIEQYRESCEAFELGRFIDLASEYASAVDACR